MVYFNPVMAMQEQGLKKTLTPLMLWGLGVGYVISGMYFGWNLGLKEGGTLGLAVATGFIILMYTAFSFAYSELACAIPKAGGVFDYAQRAMGKDMGFVAGMAQNIEFVFAPPAIALAIGAYFRFFFQEVPHVDLGFAVLVYLFFTALNIYGVKAAATFELIVTVLAVGELLLFAGVTLPHFKSENLAHNALPNGWSGAFAAIPFAIWFFLGIEGVANVAEETANPQKDILKGFGSAILTLVALCVLTFIAAIGVSGWEAIVYKNGLNGETSNSPLPLAMSKIVGENSALFHMLITVGLFGLIASFHGLILASGRSIMEFGRVGMAPAALGEVHTKFKTPANALLAGMVIGLVALFTGRTDEIITISVFGALTLYIMAMLSLIILRRKEPDLQRPFRVPLYPVTPVVALVIAVVSIVAMSWYNPLLAGIYFGLLLLAYMAYKLKG